MARALLLALAGAVGLLAAGTASAGPTTSITQAAVSDVLLGGQLDPAFDTFGIAPAMSRLAGGAVRLTFPQPEVAPRRGGTVEVYATGPSGRIEAITVTDRRWRTSANVGPCSTVAALRQAYGSSLAAHRLLGTPAAYRFGSLTFTLGRDSRVSAVTLATAASGPWRSPTRAACPGGGA